MSHTLIPYLIDTHSHLNFKAFSEEEILEILENAKGAGVEKILVVGTDLATSEKAIKMTQKYEGVWAAVGFHPIHVNRLKNNLEVRSLIKNLRDLMESNKVVAIGEIGLDYYREPFDKLAQKEMFIGILNLAKEVGKPIILHSRQAGEEVIEILKDIKGGWQGVFHCFPGDWALANKVMDLGFFVGFNGLITYSEDRKNLEVVEKIPLERLVLETDSPYLTPAPKRGERNEPANVGLVAEKVAQIKKISTEEVMRVTSENACRLFGLN